MSRKGPEPSAGFTPSLLWVPTGIMWVLCFDWSPPQLTWCLGGHQKLHTHTQPALFLLGPDTPPYSLPLSFSLLERTNVCIEIHSQVYAHHWVETASFHPPQP